MDRIRAALWHRFESLTALPFSFRLGDERIRGIPERFAPRASRRRIDANLAELRFAGVDADTGLQAEVEALVYKDYPVLEWTLWLENTGTSDTPIISDVMGGDFSVNGEAPVLQHGTGDSCTHANFETLQSPLPAGQSVHLEPTGGRPCNGNFPYLRVLFEGWGLNVAIGWPGQWSADVRGTDTGFAITTGQQHFHARLRPGERFRGPRLCVMAFEGDVVRAANMWRRWYFAHVMPRQHGAMIEPKYVLNHDGGGLEFVEATEENQRHALETFRDLGYQPDIWWIDAGWYPCPNESGENVWNLTGTWEPDPDRFPRGLRPVGDKAAECGADFLLWYEPERVTPNSWLHRWHPEWLIEIEAETESRAPVNRLLNLAIPQCADWLIEHVDAQIKEYGIGIYRQDFNFDPLPYWLTDPPDRLGITENLHIQNYLRFWDELLLRNPDLIIDSCASGGRRNDYESMRRAVTLHFTDYGYGDFAINQAMFNTMFQWIPCFRGMGLNSENEDGTFRHTRPFATDFFSMISAMTPSYWTWIEVDSPPDTHAMLQRVLPVWRWAAEITLKGDFYAVTPYTKSYDAFCCTQFDVPEENRGFVHMLAYPECEQERFSPQLYVHSPDRIYKFEEAFTGEQRRCLGRDLAGKGFEVVLEKRTGAVWFYTVENY